MEQENDEMLQQQRKIDGPTLPNPRSSSSSSTSDLSSEEQRESYHIISFDFNKEDFLCWTPHLTIPRSSFSVNLRASMALMAFVRTTSSGMSGMYIEIWVLKDYDKKEWLLDCTVDMARVLERRWFDNLMITSIGEWEHGVFYVDIEGITFVLDRRYGSVKRLYCPRLSGNKGNMSTIIGYRGSLISLESYGNLAAAETCNLEPNLLRKLWKFV